MSSFSDDEDMAGYSDDGDYGMSSDGDQSYGEVEEVPAASKVRNESVAESLFFFSFPFHRLAVSMLFSVIVQLLFSLPPLLFCPSLGV